MVDLFQNGQGRFCHAFDLLDATLEEVSQVLVSDGVKISFIVVESIKLVLSFAVFPVFAVLQQHNNPIFIEGNSLDV